MSDPRTERNPILAASALTDGEDACNPRHYLNSGKLPVSLLTFFLLPYIAIPK